ncbi:MAG: VWA domain-containing protein [Ferruginibacter sp.]|nr:VWA domain-containing protein [Ferruginibacter sp.]
MIFDYFNNVTFSQPYFFVLLIFLPGLIYWYFKNKNKVSSSIPISSIAVKNLQTAKVAFRHLPFIFRLLSLASIIVALANPQTKNVQQINEGEGIDIILGIDVSGSMTAQDLAPNRLEAAKAVAIDFVNKRITDKIGVVVFAGESFTQCPLTTDHAIIINAIQNIRSGILTDGTAIGDGLGTSIDRLRSSKAKSKIVVLLTDGENNGGLIDPKTAKEIAKSFGAKVYTIGVGTDGTTTQPVQTPLGVEMRSFKVSIDEKLLKEISDETGGKYFRAKDNIALAEIYTTINKLEKSKVEIKTTTKFSDKFFPFAICAAIFLLIEILLRYLVFRKFP